ncbi:interleukin 15, like isoform X3 [Siniperca chuatsi]|uniref:interleukin 15, like isoform X3 n=1 Tax=Siniperca chuatsi TaxID=119488 RepID=UPI001CE1D7D6|nr:interleukin 15, like isoform X3 [Siniperca chuatsi]
MLRGRRALVSVYLCFVCLLSLTAQPAAKPCTQDIIKRVKFLIIKAPDLWLHCRLYTPTIDDFQQNCPSSTLKCFANEIKVLIEEWETVQGIHSLKIRLEKLASLFNQTESECRQCELLEEKEAEVFLKGLHGTLEMMNSQHCHSTTRAPPKRLHDPFSSS